MQNKPYKTAYPEIPASVTKDGSIIRELMHPSTHKAKKQSLAEAIIRRGQSTKPHLHVSSEEIYHVLAGSGSMQLGDKNFPIQEGDSICIAPGEIHYLTNTGLPDLVILCCCTPPYSHDDTEIITEEV
ncbi:MAG: cupin domain-containing protein [Pseudomonadales bacterium]|nr:cupin domain-containing protein [Pseudomonadales bacterium]